jgi:hypothetical protein
LDLEAAVVAGVGCGDTVEEIQLADFDAAAGDDFVASELAHNVDGSRHIRTASMKMSSNYCMNDDETSVDGFASDSA